MLFDTGQTKLSGYFGLEDPESKEKLERFIVKIKAMTSHEIKVFGNILKEWHEYKPFHLKTCNLCGTHCGFGDSRFLKGSYIHSCNRGCEDG